MKKTSKYNSGILKAQQPQGKLEEPKAYSLENKITKLNLCNRS